MDQPLLRRELVVGLPVAFLGSDEEVLDWGGPAIVGVLRHGHPGRVTDVGHGLHVIVSWVGLEDADVSQVVGFCCDDEGRQLKGLARLSEEEYRQRVDAAAAGTV